MATLHQLADALGVRTSDLLVPAPGASVMPEPTNEPDALLAIRQVLTPPLGQLPDPVMIQCWTLLLQRRVAEVEQVALSTAELIEPRMSEPASPKLATWGWLMMRASAAAVRDARNDDAEQYMLQARAAAARLGNVPGQVARVQTTPAARRARLQRRHCGLQGRRERRTRP